MTAPKGPRISGRAWDETGRRASIACVACALIGVVAALAGLDRPSLIACLSAVALGSLTFLTAPAARRARRLESERRKYLRRLVDTAAHDSIERRADR